MLDLNEHHGNSIACIKDADGMYHYSSDPSPQCNDDGEYKMVLNSERCAEGLGWRDEHWVLWLRDGKEIARFNARHLTATYWEDDDA